MPDPTLALRIKAKHPGTYDDLTDSDLEHKVKLKYPSVYDDVATTDLPPENYVNSVFKKATGIGPAGPFDRPAVPAASNEFFARFPDSLSLVTALLSGSNAPQQPPLVSGAMPGPPPLKGLGLVRSLSELPEAAVNVYGEKVGEGAALAMLPREAFQAQVEHGVSLPMHRGVTAHGEVPNAPQWYSTNMETAKRYAKIGQEHAGRVNSETLTMTRPYVATGTELLNASSSTIERLKREGYDGMLAQWKTLPFKDHPAQNEIWAVKFSVPKGE